MKILSVTAQKPDSTGSGVYLSELVRGFAKCGHRQAVLAGVTKEDKIVLPEQVQVYPVYYNSENLPYPVAGMSDEMPYQSTRYRDMTEEMTKQFREEFLGKLKVVMEEFDPDVILCHHLYCLTAMIREHYPQKKVFGICHGSDLRQVKKNPWQREYIKECIPKLDGIFALHKSQKDDICAFYECDAQQVQVIGTGYNSSVFYKRENRTASEQEIRLIFAGKIAEKKGVFSLLRAVKLLEAQGVKLSLKLAGGYGAEREYGEIQALAQTCKSEVTFLGKIPQTVLAEEINRSDVFVLPSFYEGLPLVLIEAMACGANAVCTDLPGIQEWLADALPGNEVVFVTPPEMRNEDEPTEESLPVFETALAKAIVFAKQKQTLAEQEIMKLSWDSLCDVLIEYMK